MATTLDVYAPFDAGPGANVMESTWRGFAKYMLETGIIRNGDDHFKVIADSTGMQVKVGTGHCWIQGHWGENAAQKTLPIVASDPTNPRDDLVVLRADFVNNQIVLDVKTGTPAASPTEPALTQSTSLWEIRLARVRVAANAVTITAANVTDRRERYTSNEYGPGALIAEVIPTASTTSIVFDNIPQTFRHLQIVASVLSSNTTANQAIWCRFNDIATASYDLQWTSARAASVTAGEIDGATRVEVGHASSNDSGGDVNLSSSECLIPNYSRTQRHNTLSRSSFTTPGGGTLTCWSSAGWLWGSSSPIAKITLTLADGSSFKVGSQVSLYGLG
ncbi:hypothetical protein OU415_02280 [Saccharopolyspora sp. WRP15-2]|uniref:Ig-like domain-containing protein n=1 Tax=Saccharopolyspora oryzae TaxID=2997343 RepID=A0ABT4URF7_9PSEU|nr:hypothetical protein [Saccharopolyspora oryzae]MDA3624244.1 hypothetical protein [Saccharopolyspora oryzae]